MLLGLVACGSPASLEVVYCGAEHADGIDHDCAPHVEHESVFPVRWRLELEASQATAPVALDALEVMLPEGVACYVLRPPECAFGRCTLTLRQDAHGVCAARLVGDSELGRLDLCWSSHRSPDEEGFFADAASPLARCRAR